MKKSQIVIFGACIVFCCGVLFSLYALSPISKDIFRGKFDRKFVRRTDLSQTAKLNIEFNSFYLAGFSNDKIYLGNSTAPAHLLITDHLLKDTSHVGIEIFGIDSLINPRALRLSVKSNYFYVTHGAAPVILKGRVGEWKASPFIHDEEYYFSEAEPMGTSSFFIKSLHIGEMGYELAKKDQDTMVFNVSLLNKQIDGFFCVDGRMLYDSLTMSAVYVHFYRNEIIVCDSNLNLKYRTHTLDTFSRARLKVRKVDDQKRRSMLAAPPFQVNGLSCVDNGKLYVQSNILAANEEMGEFVKNTVIDVFDLQNSCKYLWSFYIPAMDNFKPTSFMVRGNTIAAVFNTTLVTFQMDSNSTTFLQ